MRVATRSPSPATSPFAKAVLTLALALLTTGAAMSATVQPREPSSPETPYEPGETLPNLDGAPRVAVEHGTVSVQLNGVTRTFEATGQWQQWQNADDPNWLEFRVDAGGHWRLSDQGVGIYAAYDVSTGRMLPQVRIWNNELTGKQLDTYTNQGNGRPTVTVTRWEEAPGDVRLIEGEFSVSLEDGGSMTGTFALQLPKG